MKNQTKNPRLSRLPNELTIALGQYFLNRQLANPQTVAITCHSDGTRTVETRDGRKWDKNADFDRICSKLPVGWHLQACAGTFWITTPSLKCNHYYANENTWPLAEVRPNKVN